MREFEFKDCLNQGQIQDLQRGGAGAGSAHTWIRP